MHQEVTHISKASVAREICQHDELMLEYRRLHPIHSSYDHVSWMQDLPDLAKIGNILNISDLGRQSSEIGGVFVIELEQVS